MPSEWLTKKRLDFFKDMHIILAIAIFIFYLVGVVVMMRPLTVPDDRSLTLDPGQNATLVELHPDVDGRVSYKIVGVVDGIVNVSIHHDGQVWKRQYVRSSGSDSFRFSRDNNVQLIVENDGNATMAVNMTTEVVFDHLFTTRDLVFFSFIVIVIIIVLLVDHRYRRNRKDSSH